ncbi:MAG: hypothetical protein R3E68_01215 [Burkholderiaceae bacterium]
MSIETGVETLANPVVAGAHAPSGRARILVEPARFGVSYRARSLADQALVAEERSARSCRT